MTRHTKAACTALLAALAASCGPADNLPAAPPTDITLGIAADSFPEPFSHVAAIREQSDGRVVVLDDQEIRIVRINFRDGSIVSLGRPGEGPGEYTLPVSLLALPGDTTVAIDMRGSGRHIVITRDSVSGAPLHAKAFEKKLLFQTSQVSADSRGRLYELSNYQQRDGSQGVRRVDRESGKEVTLGRLDRLVRSSLTKSNGSTGGSSGNGAEARADPSGMPPFASVDQWAASPDGRLAFVTVFPYRVTYYAEDGKRLECDSMSYTPVAISDALKNRFREENSRPVLGLILGADGRTVAGHSKQNFVEPGEWPELLPPFLHDAVRFAPDGTLWIERTTRADSAPMFDLIDRTGRVTSRVTLPIQSRLVGFGDKAIYIVRIMGGDELEHLERHVFK